MTMFKRWPKGALLAGYFRHDDKPVSVKLRNVMDMRDPAQKGPAPCRMLARLKIQPRIMP
jgi:hypothetical protein